VEPQLCFRPVIDSHRAFLTVGVAAPQELAVPKTCYGSEPDFHHVTSDLASHSEKVDHRQGGSGIRRSAKKSSNPFVIKILLSKPLGLKILQTLFANPAPVATQRFSKIS
jgi:hypothetical protein